MRRLVLLLALVATGALLITSTSTGQPPSRFTSTFDDTFKSSFLTAVCGFDVFVHLEGTSASLVFYDADGNVVTEIDTNPRLKVTFSAPATGKSFTYPLAGAFIQEYVNGTAIGSHLVATETGIFAGTGSTPPDAGRAVFDAVVIGATPEGIPIVDIVDVISIVGHFNEDVTAARCAALSP